MTRPLTLMTLGKAWLRPAPFTVASLPQGWLNEFDAGVLYSLAAATRGPLLEIGSWIGRSSCAMAYGLRDAVAAGAPLARFDIIDFGLTGMPEFRERYVGFDPLRGPFAEEHLRALYYPGGVAGYLKQNLVDRDLARYVNHLIFGPVASYETTVRYDAVFCDTTHSPQEIAANVPKLAGLLNAEHFLLAFDDVVDAPAAEQIQAFVDADCAALTSHDAPDNKMLVMTRGAYTRLVFPAATPIALSATGMASLTARAAMA
jgi:hypothetical protein